MLRSSTIVHDCYFGKLAVLVAAGTLPWKFQVYVAEGYTLKTNSLHCSVKTAKKEINKQKFPCLEEKDTYGHSLMPLNILEKL